MLVPAPALLLALLCSVCTSALAQVTSPPSQSAQCPPQAIRTAQDIERALKTPASDTLYPSVRALIGVDLLGRVVMALDFNRDGVIDKAMLFTAAERLSGPWSLMLESATVISSAGGVRVLADDGAFAAALATEGYSVPEISWRGRGIQDFKRSLTNGKGQELLWVKGGGRTMESLRHDTIESWPDSF
jgi:hypothetical protein